jgi:hypothetical protein
LGESVDGKDTEATKFNEEQIIAMPGEKAGQRWRMWGREPKLKRLSTDPLHQRSLLAEQI